jgi:hypothetical protein
MVRETPSRDTVTSPPPCASAWCLHRVPRMVNLRAFTTGGVGFESRVRTTPPPQVQVCTCSVRRNAP